MADSEAAEGERSVERSAAIAADDLEELEVLADSLLMAVQSNTTRPLFDIYQRLRHIVTRTRGYFEE